MRQKCWHLRYPPAEGTEGHTVSALADALGILPLTAKLLCNRGYTTPETATVFIRNETAFLHDPFLLQDMDLAVARITRAIESGERIVIYGDYDVDGVTSVSTLYLYLKERGVDVCYYIPSRSGEGYGLSVGAIDRLVGEGVNLIITVDTGITAIDEVLYARSLGIDTVITDHHECRDVLPDAAAVVNPRRPNSPYPFGELAGVGVVFKLLCALEMSRARADGESDIDAVRRICYAYADLTAIGTIADVMPLRDENRLIVSLGLRRCAEGDRVGLSALIDAASAGNSDARPAGTSKPTVKRKKITSGFIGFSIAPRINAAGRIANASRAVELFLTEAEADARALAQELCEINRQRQLEENKIAEEAYAMIEREHDFSRDPVIVLAHDNWHQGIIGIVASRITEKYGLSSILISFDGTRGLFESPDDPGKGSGRSVKGLNLVRALTACDDLLVKFGGHELAAGLTVRRGDLDEFRTRINAYARTHIEEAAMTVMLDAECEVRAEELTLEQAAELYLLEPYGISNPVPAFVLRDAELVRVTAIGGGKHTRLSVRQDDITLIAVCFGTATDAFPFVEGDRVDLLFNLDVNEYQNVKNVQLIVRDIRQSEARTEELLLSARRYEEISSGGAYTADEDIYPERDDFAQVYTVIRRECRGGRDRFALPALQTVVNRAGERAVNTVKLKFIIRILQEMQVLDVEELSPDHYRFDITFNSTKINLEKSSILRRLKAQRRAD